MTDPVGSVEAAGFLPAFYENLFAFWRDYGQSPGSTFLETPELCWFATGVNFPGLNRVLMMRANPASVEAAIDSINAISALSNVSFSWFVGPLETPADLGARLESRQIRNAVSIPGMALDLSALPDETLPVDGFRIERVEGKAGQQLFGRLVGEAYSWPADAASRFAAMEASMPSKTYERRPRFVGFFNGEPVAMAALVPAGGLAGIYAVGTLPAARGRGMGGAITTAALLEGRRAGCQVAVLQSSASGYRVYRKIGFQDVCSFDLHLQPASEGAPN